MSKKDAGNKLEKISYHVRKNQAANTVFEIRMYVGVISCVCVLCYLCPRVDFVCVRVSPQNSKEERRQVARNAHARQSKNAVFSETLTNHNNGGCNSVSSLKRTINPVRG